MTALEKMARAMFAKWLELAEDDHSPGERAEMFDENRAGFLDTARAALEALREIDRKQLAPICVERDDFVAVIDAILDGA